MTPWPWTRRLSAPRRRLEEQSRAEQVILAAECVGRQHGDPQSNEGAADDTVDETGRAVSAQRTSWTRAQTRPTVSTRRTSASTRAPWRSTSTSTRRTGRRSTRRLRIWHGRPEPREDRGWPDKPEAYRAAGEAGCGAKRSEHRQEVHRENSEEELESVDAAATGVVNDEACTEEEQIEAQHGRRHESDRQSAPAAWVRVDLEGRPGRGE
mmetsp:Transcript_132677/g.424633  ORF Transcript_132677/g.424633 Transcript_132677/m.424633 type:complete len:210 (-) Transcript_132677:440-1069(-)